MKRILLIGVFLLAFFLRFYNLGTTIPSLSHDEVAIGYNAWSILQTGKDEYGTFYPFLFRSFDDYKLPGYIYSVVISEKIFGLNAFAVRFPSAFFGFATVIVFYFLLQYLFSANSLPFFWKKYLPILATLLFAISPWHINFSRGGFEANGSLFFIVLGTYFLFLGTKKHVLWSLSAVAYIVSIYFYYTARVVDIVVITTYILLYWKEVLLAKRYFFLALIIGILGVCLALPAFMSSGLSRINQVSIFEDTSLTNPFTQALAQHSGNIMFKLFYDRRLAYIHEFIDNYLKNFAFDFYFINGTGPIGLAYIWELPFFILGIFAFLKMPAAWKWVIIAWFVSVPLVGGLTQGQPNALRTLPNAIILPIFSAYGLLFAFLQIKNDFYKKLFFILVGVVGIYCFAQFVVFYFDYNPKFIASSWGDGHQQLAHYLKSTTYDSVYVTGEYWRPYIYLLFYLPYLPKDYIAHGTPSGFDKYHFGLASWDKGSGLYLAKTNLLPLSHGKTLFILSSSDLSMQTAFGLSQKKPYTLKPIATITDSFGQPTFYAVEIVGK